METLKTKTKHGKTKTLEYRTWRTIKQRCHNEKHSHYSYYGGRGIKVCDRWMKSFENFLIDMGKKPSIKHTIDRKNSNGNYTPKNCRWATRKEQMNNTSWNVFIKYKGVTKSQTEWSELLGLHYNTIKYRLRNKWPMDKVLTPAFTYKTKKI